MPSELLRAVTQMVEYDDDQRTLRQVNRDWKELIDGDPFSWRSTKDLPEGFELQKTILGQILYLYRNVHYLPVDNEKFCLSYDLKLNQSSIVIDGLLHFLSDPVICTDWKRCTACGFTLNLKMKARICHPSSSQSLYVCLTLMVSTSLPPSF